MPKKIPEPELREIRRQISEHLTIEGPRNHEQLIARLGISRSMYYKIVNELKSLAGSPDAPGLLRVAQKQIKQAMPAEKTAKLLARQAPQLPPPSPNVVAHKGRSVIVQFDFLTEIGNLYEDAMLLQKYATRVSEGGEREIKNPVFFTAALNQRKGIIQAGIQAKREIYDVTRIQEMLDIMLGAVMEEAPECSERILNRWEELNNRYGFNVEANLR